MTSLLSFTSRRLCGLAAGMLAGSLAFAGEPVSPISIVADTNTAMAELGKKLFFDPRLSKSGFISCNSCHNLSMGGSDNLPTSIGHGWSEGPINSPTVLNAAYNVAQFWDGRAANLQEQAGGPIANPGEMASTHSAALDVLATIPAYAAEFNAVFGSPGIDITRVTQAIAEFEKTLVTPNSPFDQWLNGNAQALSAEAVAGYELFKSTGCTSCHNGPAIGGGMFMKMGVIKPYQTDNPAPGRSAVTGNEADRNVFKVPTLRNVALTYPYFHDGAVWSLDEAVDLMAKLQLGQDLNPQQRGQIVAFLQSLTGEQPQFPLPELPPSTPQTPTPEPFN
jgi:cytochrome c peroxidase